MGDSNYPIMHDDSHTGRYAQFLQWAFENHTTRKKFWAECGDSLMDLGSRFTWLPREQGSILDYKATLEAMDPEFKAYEHGEFCLQFHELGVPPGPFLFVLVAFAEPEGGWKWQDYVLIG